jgi:hypothetical protein
MAAAALPAEDYFTEEDYLPPSSPGLQPIEINWDSSNNTGIVGKKRELATYENELDVDELDLVSVPVPEISHGR